MSYNKHRQGGVLGYTYGYLNSSTLRRSIVFRTKKRIGKIQSDWVAGGWLLAFSPLAPPDLTSTLTERKGHAYIN